MNAKVSFLLIVLFTQSCLVSCDNDNLKKDISPVQKDTSTNQGSVPVKAKVLIDTISVISGKQIIGIWEDLGKETLTVEITKNTISYKEHNESHHFKIKSDSIYIYYPDLTLSGRPYLIKDTFVIAMPDGENKYIRLKK